jgi:single-stranded DNA-binding protein
MRLLWAQFKGRKSVSLVTKEAPTRCVVNGRLANDPERHSEIATFRLAVPSLHKVKGTPAEATTFCQVVVFGQMADHGMRYLTAGTAVTIFGTIVTTREVVRRRWFRRKRRVSKPATTAIVARDVQFV